MPIFEYHCSSCDQVFERIVWSDSERIECPGCGGEETRKLLSSFAVGGKKSQPEAGPCHCGAPRRGMCGEN